MDGLEGTRIPQWVKSRSRNTGIPSSPRLSPFHAYAFPLLDRLASAWQPCGPRRCHAQGGGMPTIDGSLERSSTSKAQRRRGLFVPSTRLFALLGASTNNSGSEGLWDSGAFWPCIARPRGRAALLVAQPAMELEHILAASVTGNPQHYGHFSHPRGGTTESGGSGE